MAVAHHGNNQGIDGALRGTDRPRRSMLFGPVCHLVVRTLVKSITPLRSLAPWLLCLDGLPVSAYRRAYHPQFGVSDSHVRARNILRWWVDDTSCWHMPSPDKWLMCKQLLSAGIFSKKSPE